MEKRIKISSMITTVLLLIVLTITGCGTTTTSTADPKDSKQAKTKIRYAANVGDTLWLTFAKDKGFFKQLDDAGLELDVIESKDKVALYAAKEIDFADVGGPTAVKAIGLGAPFKIIANWRNTLTPSFLVAKPEIKTIKDLKGKKIGLGAAGGIGEWYLNTLLEKEGLDPNKDVKFVNNSNGHAAVQAGFDANQYDAMVIEEPYVTYNEDAGKGHFLANIWDYVPEVQPCYITVSDDLIKNNPEAVKVLLKFTNDVWKYAKAHQDEWAEYLYQEKKIDRETLKKAFLREDPAWTNILKVDESRMIEFQKSMVKWGVQKEIYDPKKIVDQSFVK